MEKIAMLGAGHVGLTLGERLRGLGHDVHWGVPDPSKAKYAGLGVTGNAEAVRGAEVVFLAVPWRAAEEAIQSAGDLRGKVLIDATNPFRGDFSGLEDLGSSAAERIAAWAEGASVVKAFNTIGSAIMQDPRFGPMSASLLIASDHAEAKAVTARLATELGFEPLDVGPLEMARHLESVAWLWVTLALKQGRGGEIAFALHSH